VRHARLFFFCHFKSVLFLSSLLHTFSVFEIFALSPEIKMDEIDFRDSL
jgi:hypothetical protein